MYYFFHLEVSEGSGWMQWLISLCLYKISDVLLSKNLCSAFSFGSVFNDDRMHSEDRLLLSSLKQKSPEDTEMKTCLFSVLYVCFRSKMVILCSQHDVQGAENKSSSLSLHYGCRIGASAWINCHCINGLFMPKETLVNLSKVNVWVAIRFTIVLNSVFQPLFSIIHSAQLSLIPTVFFPVNTTQENVANLHFFLLDWLSCNTSSKEQPNVSLKDVHLLLGVSMELLDPMFNSRAISEVWRKLLDFRLPSY